MIKLVQTKGPTIKTFRGAMFQKRSQRQWLSPDVHMLVNHKESNKVNDGPVSPTPYHAWIIELVWL